jgi:tRNA nucleotidyltransferase/poly(A) polymerase
VTVTPKIVPRADHPISRRDIDPDALKVLYRLRQADHVAYLVGGSVRDLLLGRRPKDFDIGTSAHPAQVKKLFRNCWIIGRRFRLAHVKFGPKIIEVATFRRQLAAGEEVVAEGVPAPDPTTTEGRHLIHHDNTFGTPEEDAFRRDFTVNALAYDIADFSIIDYVGGLEDLAARVVRSIGDPQVRIHEDPVRMLRAVALASRLDFTIDPPLAEAIRKHRRAIATSSPPRLIEEYYKILRAGAAERTFRALHDVGLLEPLSAELHHKAGPQLWQSLAELDAYRRTFLSTPDTLTNPVILGSLIVPLGLPLRAERPSTSPGRPDPVEGGPQGEAPEDRKRKPPALKLGELPLARGDVEGLRQALMLQRRLRDLGAHSRVQRSLVHRGIFREALTWLDIHGHAPEIVEHWKAIVGEINTERAAPPEGEEPGDNVGNLAHPHQPQPQGDRPFGRRRRRRRRRRPSS